MKPLFIILITSFSFLSFSQNDTILKDDVIVERLVQLSNQDCFVVGTSGNRSQKEISNITTIINLPRLPFKTLDSLFQSDNYKMRMYAFSAMCGKDVMKLTDKHKTIFEDTTIFEMCSQNGPINSGFSVGQFAKMTFDQLNKMKKEGLAFPYDYDMAKKDSVINDIFQKEIDFWKQLNQFDSTSVQSKEAQNLQLLHNEHHDRVYRTYIRSISDYLIESRNIELIEKLVELISVSTSSVDETQACSFIKLVKAHPNIVLDASEKYDSHAVRTYILDYAEFCLDSNERDQEFIEKISAKRINH